MPVRNFHNIIANGDSLWKAKYAFTKPLGHYQQEQFTDQTATVTQLDILESVVNANPICGDWLKLLDDNNVSYDIVIIEFSIFYIPMIFCELKVTRSVVVLCLDEHATTLFHLGKS